MLFRSKYIHWMDHPTAIGTGASWGNTAIGTGSGSTFANLTSNVTVSLSNGADGTIATANVVTAYNYFANGDSVDVSLLVSGPADATVAGSLIDMAGSRKDCVAFISPTKASVVNNAGSEASAAVTDRKSTRLNSSH